MLQASVPTPFVSTKYIAVYEITEGGQAREIQRVTLNDPDGNLIPLPAALGAFGGFKAEIVGDVTAGDYETVAASVSDQVMGASGAAGDYLAGVLIIPGTTSPGAVSIKDGAGSAITIFTGGATSVSNLVAFFIPLGVRSVSGPWKITTGTNVTAIGVGNFS